MTNNLIFNLFSFSGLVMGIISILMSILLLFFGKLKLHRVLALFNIAVSVWGFGAYFIGNQHNQYDALIAWRVALVGVIFIAVFFYHGMCLFSNIKRTKVIIFAYLQGIFFLILNLTNSFIPNIFFYENSIYYLKSSGFLFPLWCIFWFFLVVSGFIELLIHFKEFNGVRKKQASYILFGFGVGFLGGITNFFPMFGINILPFGNVTVPVYCIVITYAMLRYKIIDIKLAVTRVGVFFLVYGFVLGIPVWIGFKLLGQGTWLIPVTLMGFFATAGPFLYIFIQKKAEDTILQEQRQYQSTLRQASAGMGKIKDLNKLLNLIVYIVTRSVRIEHALVYKYDEKNNNFHLASHKKRSGQGNFLNSFSSQNPLVLFLKETSKPIIYEEIKQKSQDLADAKLSEIEQFIAKVQGALIFPIFAENNLIAMIVLGNKESGKLYTDDDLSVFTILANQAGLAIENAKFYEDVTKTREQLYQAEKMATIGTMADGLSHQINNRFHALGFIASDALDTVNISKSQQDPQKLHEIMLELERALKRIQENVVQGGEVVQGLLRYTRKGDAGMSAIDFDKAFTAAYEMAQFKIKSHELKILREYDINQIPKIKGNFTQLQEVLFNLIDNAYDTMMQRKVEQKEPGFQATLKIRVFLEDNKVKLIFQDNGMGVKEEDFQKLFTPFFTTKLSSKKGTGLGLYVIKKIIEENHNGKVEMFSKYMQGTEMVLTVPVAYE